jgi:hypothetical protein
MTNRKKSKVGQKAQKKTTQPQGRIPLQTFGPPQSAAQKSILLRLANAIVLDEVEHVVACFREFEATGLSVFDFEFADFEVSQQKPPVCILFLALRSRAYQALPILASFALDREPIASGYFFMEIERALELFQEGSIHLKYSTEIVKLLASRLACMDESTAMQFCTGGPRSVAIFVNEIGIVRATREVAEVSASLASNPINVTVPRGAKRL